jgi:hypothetical protein
LQWAVERRLRVPVPAVPILANPALKSDGVELKTGHLGRSRMPSPSRHIYKPLTIAVAFSGLLAFDRVWQPPIKVDGTFA